MFNNWQNDLIVLRNQMNKFLVYDIHRILKDIICNNMKNKLRLLMI